MNSTLIRTVTNSEIHKAVFNMGEYKAPRFDGFPKVFFSLNGVLLVAKYVRLSKASSTVATS